MVLRHCGDFLSLKVAEGFVDWFSCWTRAFNNSHVPLLAINHLFKRSKDKERMPYGIMVKNSFLIQPHITSTCADELS